MKTNVNVSFGAIRVATGYTEAGRKAKNVCNRIDDELNIRGRAIYPESDVMFFRNSQDEDRAEEILLKEKVKYSRNPIADVADTFATQEWAETGNSNILLDWYIKSKK